MRPASPSIRAQLRRSSAAQVSRTSAAASAKVNAQRRGVLDRRAGVPARLEAGLHGQGPGAEPPLDDVDTRASRDRSARRLPPPPDRAASCRRCPSPAAAGCGAERMPHDPGRPADLTRVQEIGGEPDDRCVMPVVDRVEHASPTLGPARPRTELIGRPHQGLLAEHVHAALERGPDQRAWLDGGVQMSTKSSRGVGEEGSAESNQWAPGRRSAPDRALGGPHVADGDDLDVRAARASRAGGRAAATLPRPMMAPLAASRHSKPVSERTRRSAPRRGWRARPAPGPRG